MDLNSGEAIERGCGVREPGGIYFETLTGRNGRPVEDFLFDPPLPVAALGLPARGVLILERPDGSGVHDVWDRVGESNYPNVADMVEEIRRYGLSRRAGKGLNFSLLGPGSMIFLTHPRAILSNAAELAAMLRQERQEAYDATREFRCPCGKRAHAGYLADPVGMCAGLWWETVVKGEASFDTYAPLRTVERQNGSTAYVARQAPHGFKPAWEEGVFARFPIHQVAVIADPEGDQDQIAHRRLDGTGLPVIDKDF